MKQEEFEALLAIKGRELTVSYDLKRETYTGIVFNPTNKLAELPEVCIATNCKTRELLMESLAEQVFGGGSTNDS